MTKTIGRHTDNEIVINKLDISGHHAKITMISDDMLMVEDLNSTNGTYVNGYRINKANISFRDEVRLSENTVLDLRKIFGVPASKKAAKINPLDFTSEFTSLKSVWETYQKERVKVTKNHQLKTSLLRAGITLAPLIIWEILQVVYINQLEQTDPVAFRHWQNKYLLFSVLGSSVGVLATGTSSPFEKLQQMDEEFRVKYVCPNPACRTQLGNIPWLSYANQGKCYKCNAVYSTAKV